MSSKKKPVPQDVAPQDFETPETDGMPPQIDGKDTVGGQPIPEHLEHLIPYEATDQGRWERSQGKPKAIVQVLRDEWDGMIQQRRDQPWAASDPIKEAIARHGEPGFTHRALSKNVCDRRGMRGWETVTDSKGEPVKIGGMFLGRMPVDVAAQRNKHYRDIGNDELRNAEENLTIDQERVIRNAGNKGKGITPLRRGSTLTDSRNPDSGAVMGVENVRGEAA